MENNDTNTLKTTHENEEDSGNKSTTNVQVETSATDSGAAVESVKDKELKDSSPADGESKNADGEKSEIQTNYSDNAETLKKKKLVSKILQNETLLKILSSKKILAIIIGGLFALLIAAVVLLVCVSCGSSASTSSTSSSGSSASSSSSSSSSSKSTSKSISESDLEDFAVAKLAAYIKQSISGADAGNSTYKITKITPDSSASNYDGSKYIILGNGYLYDVYGKLLKSKYSFTFRVEYPSGKVTVNRN